MEKKRTKIVVGKFESIMYSSLATDQGTGIIMLMHCPYYHAIYVDENHTCLSLKS